MLQDTDAPVAVAAAWQAAVPSLIGADGPLLTQVHHQAAATALAAKAVAVAAAAGVMSSSYTSGMGQ